MIYTSDNYYIARLADSGLCVWGDKDDADPRRINIQGVSSLALCYYTGVWFALINDGKIIAGRIQDHTMTIDLTDQVYSRIGPITCPIDEICTFDRNLVIRAGPTICFINIFSDAKQISCSDQYLKRTFGSSINYLSVGRGRGVIRTNDNNLCMFCSRLDYNDEHKLIIGDFGHLNLMEEDAAYISEIMCSYGTVLLLTDTGAVIERNTGLGDKHCKDSKQLHFDNNVPIKKIVRTYGHSIYITVDGQCYFEHYGGPKLICCPSGFVVENAAITTDSVIIQCDDGRIHMFSVDTRDKTLRNYLTRKNTNDFRNSAVLSYFDDKFIVDLIAADTAIYLISGQGQVYKQQRGKNLKHLAFFDSNPIALNSCSVARIRSANSCLGSPEIAPLS